MNASLTPSSLWNYNPGNNDTLGDDWNFENFSWFSEQGLDERTRVGARGKELDEGCRLLKAVVVSFRSFLKGSHADENLAAVCCTHGRHSVVDRLQSRTWHLSLPVRQSNVSTSQRCFAGGYTSFTTSARPPYHHRSGNGDLPSLLVG